MGFLSDFFGGSKKAPPVPSAESRITAEDLMNRYNIYTPTGSRFFSTDPSGRTSLNIQETPFQQQTRALREGLATEYLQSLAGGDDRFAAEGEKIADTIFQSGLKRLEPFLERRRRQTDVKLSTMGLPMGSEARRGVISEQSLSEGDVLSDLLTKSILAGSDQQAKLRELALKEAGVFAPELAPISNTQFGQVAGINAANIIGDTYGQQLERYQIDEARKQDRAKKIMEFIQAGAGPASSGLSSFFSGGGAGGSFGSSFPGTAAAAAI